MHILHLPSNYLPESLGGTEVYVQHLCEGLQHHGHTCTVAYHSTTPNVLSDTAVQRLSKRLPRRRADLYLYQAGDLPDFVSLLRQLQPDVVHFHALTIGAGPDHARAARDAGLPYVVTYHTPSMSCLRGTLLRWGETACDGEIQPSRCAACCLQGQGMPRLVARGLALSPLSYRLLPEGPWIPRLALASLISGQRQAWREFMLGAACVVACSAWCKEVLLRNGLPEARVRVLRQALPETHRRRRLRLPASGRPLRLGFFGRCTPMKGPDLLLKSLSVLARAGLPVVCELAGPVNDGDRKWFESFLAAEPSARWIGVKRGTELTAWLDTLDLVVVPSRCLETGPLTLLEAWDRGVPVVGADLGGIRDFLQAAGLDSLLFTPNDPPALAAAVQRAAEWRAEAPEVNIPGMDELVAAMERIYAEVSKSQQALTAAR